MPSRIALPLRNVHIASPCPAKWDDMDGDDRKRFCHQCSKHVYDFAGLRVDEIRALLDGGDVCGRMYRRTDGTILTADCPVGIRMAYTRVGRLALRAAAVCVGLFAAGLSTIARADGYGEAFARSHAMMVLQRFAGRLTPPPAALGMTVARPTPADPRG